MPCIKKWLAPKIALSTMVILDAYKDAKLLKLSSELVFASFKCMELTSTRNYLYIEIIILTWFCMFNIWHYILR